MKVRFTASAVTTRSGRRSPYVLRTGSSGVTSGAPPMARKFSRSADPLYPVVATYRPVVLSSGRPSFSSSGQVAPHFTASGEVFRITENTPSGVSVNSLRKVGPRSPVFGR